MSIARTSRPLDVRFDQSGICVLESHHSDDFRMAWTRHDFWKVLLVINGASRLLTRRDNWTLTRSSLALVPPRIEHRLADEPGPLPSIYGLCVADGPPYLALREMRLAKPSVIHSAEIIALAGKTLRRLLIETSGNLPGQGLISPASAMLLLGHIQRHVTTGNRPDSSRGEQTARERVESYIRTLNAEFSEPDTLDSIANRLELSRRRFTQLFRDITGEAWLPHVRRLRLQHAKRLLRDPDRSIAAVAFECGFEDLSHFYRTFKEHTGKTPHQWRLR